MSLLAAVALGVAIAEVDEGVHEEGGNNRGPRIKKYLAEAGQPEGSPWCAAAVHYCALIAARACHIANPLEDVKLKAYVQSYYEWASANGLLVPADQAEPGDLILFNFHGERWDHVGMVLEPPVAGSVRTVEGNTNDGGSSDGDGFYFKARAVTKGVAFVRWAA